MVDSGAIYTFTAEEKSINQDSNINSPWRYDCFKGPTLRSGETYRFYLY